MVKAIPCHRRLSAMCKPRTQWKMNGKDSVLISVTHLCGNMCSSVRKKQSSYGTQIQNVMRTVHANMVDPMLGTTPTLSAPNSPKKRCSLIGDQFRTQKLGMTEEGFGTFSSDKITEGGLWHENDPDVIG